MRVFGQSARATLSPLRRIASDAGIVGILERRKWHIGALLDLGPVEVKLLGLNRNRGEQILLRLRRAPPDSNVFLPYSEIRDTMLHELAHCVQQSAASLPVACPRPCPS